MPAIVARIVARPRARLRAAPRTRHPGACKKIFIADDYQSATPKLAAWSKLAGHDVTVCTETIKDPAKLPAGIEQAEALLLIQQRAPFTQAHLDRMPSLKVIAQTGKNVAHIDMDACTKRGVAVVAAGVG